ncbi:MAG: alpha/beta hydrolase [Opitutae bacterium]|mgnify:CR=1 FL=1|nr:alpha/beta hydrolase [Opitutae bacterium]
MNRRLLIPWLFLCLPILILAQKKKAKNPNSRFDLEYAKVDGISLKLDLLMPAKKTDRKPELVVFFHGGSWRSGSKKTCHVGWLTHHGYAVASVDYRLSGQAKFPALAHDCKGAIRWLRANADKLGINAERICAAGASAGGLLSTLVGTSGEIKAIEGTIGGNLDQSSRVQSVLGMFCPTDLYYNATVEKERCDQPNCPLYQLLGGKPSERLDMAKLASSTAHVTKDDPPVILLYGTADKSLVKPLHGERLKARYDKAGLDATYQLIEGAGHGGPQYRDKERSKLILDMLQKTLR